MKNDPATGKFVPGNPGRPKGSKNIRTRNWDEVGASIVNDHAGHFADVLENLMASDKLTDQVKGAELFLKAVEFFKPKMKREGQPDPWGLGPMLQ